MIHNPYAKAAKRPRPNEIANRDSHPPPLQEQPCNNNNNDVLISNHDQHVNPVKNASVNNNITSNTSSLTNHEVFTDLFDTGIDWGAAIAIVDQQKEKVPRLLLSNHQLQQQQASISKKTMIPSSAPAVAIMNKETINQAIGKQLAQQMPQPSVSLSIPSQKPAAPPTRPPPQNNNNNSLASLRPPTWDKKSTSGHPSSHVSIGTKRPPTPSTTTTITSASPASLKHLPSTKQSIISSLPPSLQFDYPIQPPNKDDNLRPILIQHATLSQPLDNGWTLFSHQKRAILRGLIMRRMILALDMGLGKTLTACVWARAFQKTYSRLKIIIICPVSLTDEWKRTAEQATSLTVQPKPACDWTSTDVCIASWGKIPAIAERDQGPMKFVVIADEAHSMQSMEASRTRDALKLMLCEDVHECVGVLLLTGTPMKNGKPGNLFPLLKAVKHPFGNHQRDYETHFCAGSYRHFGARSIWNANGASNLVELRELVSSHVLHITKDAVMKDLPPKQRLIHTVPVSAKSQQKHIQAMRDLARVYNAPDRENIDKNESILGAVQKVRMVGSFAKVDATVQLAQQRLQDEPAIVIFTSFVDVAKLVHQRLTESGWEGQLLTGETPPKKRQKMVDDFQNGLSPVFVVTFGAGGVGLTLTAACTVILLDRPWTPGDALQAEDRVRRIGQTKSVTSIWVSAFDLDKQIDAMLEQKNNTSNTVLTEGECASLNAEAPRINIFQMLRSILPGPGGNVAAVASEMDSMRQTSMLEFSQKVSE